MISRMVCHIHVLLCYLRMKKSGKEDDKALLEVFSEALRGVKIKPTTVSLFLLLIFDSTTPSLAYVSTSYKIR
jgi:hypothetical protein